MSTIPTPELTQEYLAWQKQRLLASLNHFKRAISDPTGLLADLYLFHWLRREVAQPFRMTLLVSSYPNFERELTGLLLASPGPSDYIQAVISYWLARPTADDPRHRNIQRLLADHDNQPSKAGEGIIAQWRQLGKFQQSYQESIRQIQARQKLIAEAVGGGDDQQRLALVDRLPKGFSGGDSFEKMGIIPNMACHQNCRHCMFVWRPPLKKTPDPGLLFQHLNSKTANILFTGGDLGKRMAEFYRAIVEMKNIGVFAILLNGALAVSLAEADSLFLQIQKALKGRPNHFPPARVTLQISFDEYHQEIGANDKGEVWEKIPVVNIANLVVRSIFYPEVQFVLLHKQNRLNFSDNLYKFGVFARLSRTLAALGSPIESINWQTSPRTKADPVSPDRMGGVIRDTVFTLKGYPENPIHMMSSSIDAYGRAILLDPSEYINERAYLKQIIEQGPPPGEYFDIDPMVWYDGSVTLFAAAHLWLGNLYADGDRVFHRYRKDPLLWALKKFDPALLNYYSELSNDLEILIKSATGPHHLFHQLTESAPMRLHMTKRLIANL
jgi:hypothetical protein